jgi:hypothetical protein
VWFKFLGVDWSNTYQMALVPCQIDQCRWNGILFGKTSHFSTKISNLEFCILKCYGSNFQRYYQELACMPYWVWYFRSCRSTVVIKMANSLVSLSYFLIWIKLGIFLWIQFLWILLSNRLPKNSLVHFSDAQRISENYYSVIVILLLENS